MPRPGPGCAGRQERGRCEDGCARGGGLSRAIECGAPGAKTEADKGVGPRILARPTQQNAATNPRSSSKEGLGRSGPASCTPRVIEAL
jgi:hypothetical protein